MSPRVSLVCVMFFVTVLLVEGLDYLEHFQLVQYCFSNYTQKPQKSLESDQIRTLVSFPDPHVLPPESLVYTRRRMHSIFGERERANWGRVSTSTCAASLVSAASQSRKPLPAADFQLFEAHFPDKHAYLRRHYWRFEANWTRS